MYVWSRFKCTILRWNSFRRLQRIMTPKGKGTFYTHLIALLLRASVLFLSMPTVKEVCGAVSCRAENYLFFKQQYLCIWNLIELSENVKSSINSLSYINELGPNSNHSPTLEQVSKYSNLFIQIHDLSRITLLANCMHVIQRYFVYIQF